MQSYPSSTMSLASGFGSTEGGPSLLTVSGVSEGSPSANNSTQGWFTNSGASTMKET